MVEPRTRNREGTARDTTPASRGSKSKGTVNNQLRYTKTHAVFPDAI